MKFPKLLIPFLAVVLPTIHISHENLNITVKSDDVDSKREDEITTDESDSHGIILRQFSDSERFLNFVKHSSHRSHSSHQSHTSHQSGSHSFHYSSSGAADCNGCEVNIEDEETENPSFENASLIAKR